MVNLGLNTKNCKGEVSAKAVLFLAFGISIFAYLLGSSFRVLEQEFIPVVKVQIDNEDLKEAIKVLDSKNNLSVLFLNIKDAKPYGELVYDSGDVEKLSLNKSIKTLINFDCNIKDSDLGPNDEHSYDYGYDFNRSIMLIKNDSRIVGHGDKCLQLVLLHAIQYYLADKDISPVKN